MGAATKTQNLRHLSLLYSSSSLKKILQEESLSSVKNKVQRHGDALSIEDKECIYVDLLTILYQEMTKGYCNEYIYKNTILNQLLINKYSLYTTTLLNEFRISKSIADLVLINGEVKLFEVKTDLDTLNRLGSQLQDYKKAVEKVYIVTSSKYINQISDLYANTCYGIIELTKSEELNVCKEAQIDKSEFDHVVIMKLLRKQEYLNIVRGHFGEVPQVPNTLLFKECLQLVKTMDVQDFQGLAFKQLKSRKLLEPSLLLDINIPKELRFLCHSMNLNHIQYHTLFGLLNKSI